VCQNEKCKAVSALICNKCKAKKKYNEKLAVKLCVLAYLCQKYSRNVCAMSVPNKSKKPSALAKKSLTQNY